MNLGPMMPRPATRAELIGGMERLERAIGTPPGDPLWRPGLTRAVAHLRAAFTEHVLETEGDAGLYAGLLQDAPRLARGVSDLVGEHAAVLSTLASQTGLGREVFMLDNNLKTPYSDQFSLGMRNQVGEWNTSVALSPSMPLVSPVPSGHRGMQPASLPIATRERSISRWYSG